MRNGRALSAATATAAALFGCSSNSPSSDPSAAWPVGAATGLRAASFGPVPPLPFWQDAAVTDASTTLGAALFHDARLSGSGHTACTNCHFPANEFQSSGPKDAPDRSYPALSPTLTRNTPSLNNIVYAQMARWDGSYFTDVFGISALPFAEANMNAGATLPPSDVQGVDLPATQAALYQKFTVTIPGYVQLFQDAYGVDVRTLSPAEVFPLVGDAIAAYERIAVSRDSAFDAWNAGDAGAMSASAIRGFALFQGSAQCSVCHSGALFTDFAFHNVGFWPPAPDGGRADPGRYLVTGDAGDLGAFLTPTLRAASMTSPYFHDGSQVSLATVISMKANAALRDADPAHDPLMDRIPPLDSGEVADLVAFIEALRGAEIPATVLSAPVVLP